MDSYVVDLAQVDRTSVPVTGGKGAALGELSRVAGIRVPAGFCVTTRAFTEVVSGAPSIAERLRALSGFDSGDREGIAAVSAQIRRAVEEVVIPGALAAEVTSALSRLGTDVACAVRSSATAEDLPAASFAGQQDSYLSVVGPDAVLRHISRCWASLFTERAVSYRVRNRFDHRAVRMAVIVQRMVAPESAGVMFTADPVTGDRRVITIEAGYGLAEGLVAGRVDADVHTVRDGAPIATTVAIKRTAVHASPEGGTRERAVAPGRQTQPALTEAQILRLAELGRRIEAHFGGPQDIEWCVAEDVPWIVQSRPITTLFPVPLTGDDDRHVYVSVGHQQMMTDAMRSLGLSLFQLTAMIRMYDAGGRLFVDVAPRLASAATREATVEALGKGDPLIGDALRTVITREDIIGPPQEGSGPPPAVPPGGGPPVEIEADPALVAELIARTETSIAALERDIATISGAALVDFIVADVTELKRLLRDPDSLRVIMGGMEATWWLNEHLETWLGETNAADTLAQAVPGNVTSEMGLALLDVADVIRPHADVVAFLEEVEDEGFLDRLVDVDGGREARDAIRAYLDRYGMRCVGEIDITRPRWSERPSTLVPLILANVRNFTAGAGPRRVAQGRREASLKRRELLERVRALPDGESRADEVTRMIDRVWAFSGYREFPKYGIVRRYFIYKRALLAEAGRLVDAGVLGEIEDVFHLTLPELGEVIATGGADGDLIRRRREAFRSYEAMTPPRVMTSDGEVITGAYRRDGIPEGALAGLAVSAGTIEGPARVVLDMGAAELRPGDILVTTFTDPSWTPAFVTVAGLVTEVGGLMTHGAVIAREYGLPAVVGVGDATRLIRDGQRIRVHGTSGYVEILE